MASFVPVDAQEKGLRDAIFNEVWQEEKDGGDTEAVPTPGQLPDRDHKEQGSTDGRESSRYLKKAEPKPVPKPKVKFPVLSSWLAAHPDLYANPNLDNHVTRWVLETKAADGTAFTGTASDIIIILERLRNTATMSGDQIPSKSKSVAEALTPFLQLPSASTGPSVSTESLRVPSSSNPNAERNRKRAAMRAMATAKSDGPDSKRARLGR